MANLVISLNGTRSLNGYDAGTNVLTKTLLQKGDLVTLAMFGGFAETNFVDSISITGTGQLQSVNGIGTMQKAIGWFAPEPGFDIEIWWGVVTATGAITVTLNYDGGSYPNDGSDYSWQELKATTTGTVLPFWQCTNATNLNTTVSSKTCKAPSITPGLDAAIVAYICGTSGPLTGVADSGYTYVADDGDGIFGYNVATTASAQQCSATQPTSGGSSSIVASFTAIQPTAGGARSHPQRFSGRPGTVSTPAGTSVITIVQYQKWTYTGGTTGGAAPFTNNVTPGNTLVAVISVVNAGGGQISAIESYNPSIGTGTDTWVNLANAGRGKFNILEIWAAADVEGGAYKEVLMYLTASGFSWQVAIYEVAGLPTTLEKDLDEAQYADTWSIGPNTPVIDKEIIFAAIAQFDYSYTALPGSPWIDSNGVIVDANGYGYLDAVYQIQDAAAAATATWTTVNTPPIGSPASLMVSLSPQVPPPFTTINGARGIFRATGRPSSISAGATIGGARGYIRSTGRKATVTGGASIVAHRGWVRSKGRPASITGSAAITAKRGTARVVGRHATVTASSSVAAARGFAKAHARSATVSGSAAITGHRGFVRAHARPGSVSGSSAIQGVRGVARSHGRSASITVSVAVAGQRGFARAFARPCAISAGATIQGARGTSRAFSRICFITTGTVISASRATVRSVGRPASITGGAAVAGQRGMVRAFGRPCTATTSSSTTVLGSRGLGRCFARPCGVSGSVAVHAQRGHAKSVGRKCAVSGSAAVQGQRGKARAFGRHCAASGGTILHGARGIGRWKGRTCSITTSTAITGRRAVVRCKGRPGQIGAGTAVQGVAGLSRASGRPCGVYSAQLVPGARGIVRLSARPCLITSTANIYAARGFCRVYGRGVRFLGTQQTSIGVRTDLMVVTQVSSSTVLAIAVLINTEAVVQSASGSELITGTESGTAIVTTNGSNTESEN